MLRNTLSELRDRLWWVITMEMKVAEKQIREEIERKEKE